MHALWRKKAFLSDTEVVCADQAAKHFGVCWHLMRWKPVLWVPWTAPYSAWFYPKTCI